MSILNQIESYYFSGVAPGWFSRFFESQFSRFPFIGAREKLVEMQREKRLSRGMFDSIGKKSRITPLLNLVTEQIGIKSPKAIDPGKVAEDLIKKLDEEGNRRTLETFLSETQDQCRRERRYFDTVSTDSKDGAALAKASQPGLQNEIVVVTGQLVHKSAIAQYNELMAQTVATLPGEWLVVDFPPHGMAAANDGFDGRVVALVIEKGFAELFNHYLPFRTDFGWYPYARITGFFKEPEYGQSAPSISVIMTEFIRPLRYAQQGRELLSFLGHEMRDLIYLKGKSDLILAGYLLPLLASGSNIESFKASGAEKDTLSRYLEKAGDELPFGLRDWYARIA